MKRVVLMTLLAVTLSAGSCLTIRTETTGDFCVVARPLAPNSNAVSDYLNHNDPDLAKGLISHNVYGERRCNWF